MKTKTVIILFFFFASAKVFSQVVQCGVYFISFEGTGVNENDTCHNLYDDTISNPLNIWQIGSPHKPVFASAYTNPNVIVTDTANHYPVNDTSSFIISHTAGLGFTYT